MSRKAKRRLRISIVVAVVVIAAGILGVRGTLRRGLPQISGTLEIPGLVGAVTVTRDEEGVPHITAENAHDLFFAQGFVQAQDRLFQMDLSRRQASGRLSEVYGAQALGTDKRFRILGLRRAAEASWPLYTGESAAALKSFSDGVNAFIAMNENKLSVEFFLNGYKPEPWTPVDSLVIGKYMSHTLAGGRWENQAFRLYLLENFSEEEALELFPENTNLPDEPLIIGSLSIANVFLADTLFEPSAQNTDDIGSNNWVVSGAKTASGKPLLSGDPHMALATPSVWYQMHLQGGAYDVSGVTMCGVPGIILGHNKQIAWGVTNTMPSVQDLYIEMINPNNPRQYLYGSEWLDLIEIPEPIRIRGGRVEDFTVLVTRHGPIISDLTRVSEDGLVYALQWTALQPSLELEAILNMDRAADWASFEKALEDFDSPMQNFVFADSSGTIAFKANGKLPIRGNGGDGLLPARGWTAEHEWVGYVPFDELPRIVNSPEGFIASANNKVINDYPYHISHDWVQPFRQRRIVEYLVSRNDLTADDMRTLQADVLDLHAKEMLPIMIAGVESMPLTERQLQALAVLKAWDFQFTAEQAAPLLFAHWFQNTIEVIFEDRFTSEMIPLFRMGRNVMDSLLRRAHNGETSLWVEAQGGFGTVLLAALERTIAQAEKTQGKNMAAWQWGRFHQVDFTHQISNLLIMRPVFNPRGRQPSPGANTTVRFAGWNRNGLNNTGAGWRFVFDFATPDYALHLVAPGQSGHPLSPYYHRQFDRWIAGELYRTYTAGFTGEVLTLKPLKP